MIGFICFFTFKILFFGWKLSKKNILFLRRMAHQNNNSIDSIKTTFIVAYNCGVYMSSTQCDQSIDDIIIAWTFCL